MARAPIVKERAPGEGRNSRTPEKKCGGARRGNEALACARLWFQRWARATRRARAWRLRAFAGGRSGKAAESDGGDTPRRPRRPCIVETPACTGGGLACVQKGGPGKGLLVIIITRMTLKKSHILIMGCSSCRFPISPCEII